jgi:hypothetical protein
LAESRRRLEDDLSGKRCGAAQHFACDRAISAQATARRCRETACPGVPNPVFLPSSILTHA